MESFTAITPTGDRPEAFELCKLYIQRQTILPTQWIIVDDGRIPLANLNGFTPNITYIRRHPSPSDPPHTLAVQMKVALGRVCNDKIIMVEDDDWYSRNYFEQMLKMFDGGSILVGTGNTIYYHIPRQRYYIHSNRQHASWCMTGFKINLLPVVRQICDECIRSKFPYVDLKVWRKVRAAKELRLDYPPLCIGIKGLPGRKGTVSGHTNTEPFEQDVDFKFLRECVGEDVELYRKFLV